MWNQLSKSPMCPFSLHCIHFRNHCACERKTQITGSKSSEAKAYFTKDLEALTNKKCGVCVCVSHLRPMPVENIQEGDQHVQKGW